MNRTPVYARPAPRRAAKLPSSARGFTGTYAPGSAASSAPLFSKGTFNASLQAAAHYRAIARAGGWRRIPRGRTLKRGDAGQRVVLLKYRLIATGDYPRSPSITSRFDTVTQQAVKRFQSRHGLTPDGAAGAATLKAMNVSASQRLAILQKNLQRIQKKIASGLPARFVMVNIPDYRAEIVESGVVRAGHNVVVGRASRQTNIIKAQITETNFYPSWHVPQSIVVRDLLPRLRRGENVLGNMRMQVFRNWGGKPLNPAIINWNLKSANTLKFKQAPGTDNALGMVRLNMPNRHAIYMHDTPVQNLLNRRKRAFSSGCVRVKDVFKLAHWLLKDTAGWNAGRIQAAVRAGSHKTVKLNRPVTVYFDYLTAWARPGAPVQFRPDIYARDGAVKLASRRK